MAAEQSITAFARAANDNPRVPADWAWIIASFASIGARLRDLAEHHYDLGWTAEAFCAEVRARWS